MLGAVESKEELVTNDLIVVSDNCRACGQPQRLRSPPLQDLARQCKDAQQPLVVAVEDMVQSNPDVGGSALLAGNAARARG